MKSYTINQLRNVAIAGHSGVGKTSLAEALLFHFKSIDKLGTVETRTTQSDYDPEEHARHLSINSTVLPVELEDMKINLLDTPGSRDFVGDTKNAIRVAETALIVVDAVAGSEVGTEFAWDYTADYNVPHFVFINKMDKERANFANAMATIREHFGTRVVPVTLPIGEGAAFKGVIDLLDMKAVYEDVGKTRIEEIPAGLLDAAKAARRELIEAAAEGDDDLTEKFLSGEELTGAEITKGLREDMEFGRFCPVLCGAATRDMGMTALRHFIAECCPSPAQRTGFALHVDNGNSTFRKLDPNAPFSAYVFKTVSDDFAGRLSIFKAITGTVPGDGQILNVAARKQERTGHVLAVRGKTTATAPGIIAGDIGAFSKLETVRTGDTICDVKSPSGLYEPTHLPAPTAFARIATKNRNDEDKISIALHRLLESDPTLKVERDSSLKQTVISGMGETHLAVAAARLKAKTHIDVELTTPRIAYRETVLATNEAQGKYKRQTGGHGQYGDCHVRLEPLERGAGFQFVWAIVGGVIPTNFQSSVEKGVVSALQQGSLAEYPVVDVRAICYDGSYHDVDSSDMAFQTAASLAIRNVLPLCAPAILEPFLKVRILIPDSAMGDVLGYVSQHRGRVAGEGEDGNGTLYLGESHRVILTVEMPQAEMSSLSRDLRQLTHGRGTYSATFLRYDVCPPAVQAKVVDEAKQWAKEHPDQ